VEHRVKNVFEIVIRPAQALECLVVIGFGDDVVEDLCFMVVLSLTDEQADYFQFANV